MASWNDGESSGESILGDLTGMDYAPDTLHDPTFCGLAVGCEKYCRVHKQVPLKCVAFEGTNTGRRFYLCVVQNDVLNCGFVDWVDDDWPDSLKLALSTLWGMYEDSNSAMLDEKIENGKLIQELSEEKNKADKKYTSLLADVKKFIYITEKQVHKENLAKMDAEKDPGSTLTEFLKKEAEKDLGEMEIKMDFMKNELLLLNQVHKADLEMMKIRQKKWDVEREKLKEEKKKVEYMLYDLLKVSDANKDKLKRLKAILDE